MTGDRSILKNITKMYHEMIIHLADDSVITAKEKGDVNIHLKCGKNLLLKNVVYIPNLGDNLFSV